MSRTTSPSTRQCYGVSMVTKEWELPRSSFYRTRAAKNLSPGQPTPRKRGPRTELTDEALLVRIREDLKATPFHGEGHRKVWARLRIAGVRTAKRRVLRLMRENNLLSPQRTRQVVDTNPHDGTIITHRPDVMWGTDATSALTLGEGNATIFIAVDHCTAECLGIHAAKHGTRFEALEVIRQAVRSRLGSYVADVARGLKLRHDNGSQFVSDVYQQEIDWLGIESSPSFVRQPEGNGCAERLIRTLKEQLLWVRHFSTVEELRQALHAWMEQYNAMWLIERNGYRTPNQVRQAFLPASLAA